MAISDVQIANLALLKLGQSAITSLDDNTNTARAFAGNYEILRDKLQRRRWNFNRAYAQLPLLSTYPPFEYQYAYQLPSDYLRLELASQAQPVAQQAPVTDPPTITFGPPISVVGMPGVNLSDYNNGRAQDYRIVGQQIWTNIPSPLSIIYGKREPDPNTFDAFFVEAFAAYLAWQMCERITNSNQKKAELRDEFRDSMWEALNAKAIELPPETIPDDTWMLARISS